MLSQVEAVDVAKRTKDMLLKLARDNRLMAERLLAARKDQIKVEEVQRGQKALAEHLAALNVRLGKPYMPNVMADFGAAIKGLRTVASLKNAVDTLLASVKISSSATADLIQTNMATMRELAADHVFLFSDTATIALKANDDLTALVKMRIADHQANELAKEEATRARIRVEEVAKAESQARAKVLAEQAAELAEAQRMSAIQAAGEKVAAEFAAQQKAPQIIQEIIQAAPIVANVVPMRATQAPAAQTPPSLKLGQISERLGFNLTGEFLKNLGFEPAAQIKNAVLFHERDFPLMCMRLVSHIQGVQRQSA